jgi:hypothetical protein
MRLSKNVARSAEGLARGRGRAVAAARAPLAQQLPRSPPNPPEDASQPPARAARCRCLVARHSHHVHVAFGHRAGRQQRKLCAPPPPPATTSLIVGLGLVHRGPLSLEFHRSATGSHADCAATADTNADDYVEFVGEYAPYDMYAVRMNAEDATACPLSAAALSLPRYV